MSNPLDITLKFLAYTSSGTTNDPKDADKIESRVQESDTTEISRYKQSVPDATTDLEIALPNDPSDYLLIFTDYQISIKLNGSTDALTLSPRANGTKTFVYYTRGTLTGLTVSNASGFAASIDVIAVRK